MPNPRIAVLFDAENIAADAAAGVLAHLRTLGTLRTARAVGDFSGTLLAPWIGQAKLHGIEMVMQPGLGAGKNSADILLTIEAMDIAHRGDFDAIGLVTSDRDFAPLALRLRHMGLDVFGFGRANSDSAFTTACTQFHAIDVARRPSPAPKTEPPKAMSGMQLSAREVASLLRIAQSACPAGNDPIAPATLRKAIADHEPALVSKLTGKSKFLKTLVAHGIVERVGTGPSLQVQTPKLRTA